MWLKVPEVGRESKVRITWYSYEKKRFGPVEIGVLIPAKTYESVEVGDPIEIILSLVEKGSRNKEGDYYEVRVEGPGIIEIVGESPRYKSQRSLFLRPAKLRRIGVLLRDAVNSSGEGDYLQVSFDSFQWYDVDEHDYYIYEGVLNADDDVVAVLLDTSEGYRLIIPAGRDKLLRDALSR